MGGAVERAVPEVASVVGSSFTETKTGALVARPLVLTAPARQSKRPAAWASMVYTLPVSEVR